jgi:hypothetical protein
VVVLKIRVKAAKKKNKLLKEEVTSIDNIIMDVTTGKKMKEYLYIFKKVMEREIIFWEKRIEDWKEKEHRDQPEKRRDIVSRFWSRSKKKLNDKPAIFWISMTVLAVVISLMHPEVLFFYIPWLTIHAFYWIRREWCNSIIESYNRDRFDEKGIEITGA